MTKGTVAGNGPLTHDRSNTSEYLKRLSIRSKNSNKPNSPQIVAVVVQEVIRVAGVIEGEARAEEPGDVVEGEGDNEAGSCFRR